MARLRTKAFLTIKIKKERVTRPPEIAESERLGARTNEDRGKENCAARRATILVPRSEPAMNSSPRFRKGMKVCSIYEPGRMFVIDESVRPGRLFHEGGATLWYTTKELLPANKLAKLADTTPTSPPTPQNRNALYVRSQALHSMNMISRQRNFTCAECGARVERKRKARALRRGERSFCCAAHRAAFWKRQRNGGERTKHSATPNFLTVKKEERP